MRFGMDSGGYTHTSSPNGYGYTLTKTKKKGFALHRTRYTQRGLLYY